MTDLDAIVVGGGASGMAAARRLRAHGLSVVVVEARNRLGGRTYTVQHEGGTVDLGGQWVGPGQNRVLALIEELGIRTYPQFDRGKRTVELDGLITRYRGDLPKVGMRALLDLGRAAWRFDRAAKKVSASAPWEAAGADALDAQSIEQWIDANATTQQVRQILHLATNAVLAEHPARISWLHFLYYAAGAGGLWPLISVKNGAQQDRIRGGAQQLSEGLAKLANVEVLLSQPVQRIEQTHEGVVVTTVERTLRARHAVVALAPAMCKAIEFSPALPKARKDLHERMTMGSVVKCVVGYSTPFWRDRGLSAEAISNGTWGRLHFDNSTPEAKMPSIVTFVFSDAAKKFGKLPEEERRRLIVQDHIRLFGAQAADVQWYLDKDWPSDPLAGGCYTGLFSPGSVRTLARALREPCGRVHFAGTETATAWPGYIEGAIEAGERAADEIKARA